MIARARAPLSPVEPLLSSRYEPDGRVPAFDGSRLTGDPSALQDTTRPERAGEDIVPEPSAVPPSAGQNISRATRIPGTRSLAIALIAPGAGTHDGTRHEGGAPPDDRDERDRAVRPDARASEPEGASVTAPLPAGIDVTSRAARHHGPSRLSSGSRAGDAAGRGLVETRKLGASARRDGEASAPAFPLPDAPQWRAVSPIRPAYDASAHRGVTEVTISIGHIEVRSAPPAEPVRKALTRPRVTLEEYLRRRQTDGR